MKNNKITVKTGNLEQAAKEFVDVWHQAEHGQVQQGVVEKLSFKDQALLFKTLTRRRIEILQYVHDQDGMSIRALAKALGRDYSNVHQDVKILHQLGLMVKNQENDKYYVPWDVIVTEIPLSSASRRKRDNRKTHVIQG